MDFLVDLVEMCKGFEAVLKMFSGSYLLACETLSQMIKSVALWSLTKIRNPQVN